MTIIEEGLCKIQSINDEGLGVGKTSLGSVELPYSLPGELVSFERHKYRRATNCVLKEIVEYSEHRTKPPCKYFGACGGCLLQHMDGPTYYDFKYNVILKSLTQNNITTKINPIITVPPSNRRRANLEAIKKDGQVFLGFHRFHSHQIINIDSCLALIPELSNLLMPFKEALNKILDNRQKAQIFVTKAYNGIDFTITIQEQKILSAYQREILSSFAEDHNITRFTFRHRRSVDIIREIAKPFVLFDNIEVEIDAYCFLQSSSLSDDILSKLVLNFFKENADNARIADLFCGRGTYSLPLSGYFKVDGFESDKLAVAALLTAAQRAGREINLELRDLFNAPLTKLELDNYSYLVVNPPRAGAENQCHNLAQANIKKICYVSCNPKTFARDAKILMSGNYELTGVTPVNQFYWSPHLEIVGFFKGNSKSKLIY